MIPRPHRLAPADYRRPRIRARRTKNPLRGQERKRGAASLEPCPATVSLAKRSPREGRIAPERA